MVSRVCSSDMAWERVPGKGTLGGEAGWEGDGGLRPRGSAHGKVGTGGGAGV